MPSKPGQWFAFAAAVAAVLFVINLIPPVRNVVNPK